MNIRYTGSCVDHTFELVSENSIEEGNDMRDSVKKVQHLINYMKDSSLANEGFYNIMNASGADPLAIMQGTDNRLLKNLGLNFEILLIYI